MQRPSCCSRFTASTNFSPWYAARCSARLIDAFGHHEALADKVSAAHSVWLALLNRSIELESAADERSSRLDLLRHQLHELEALAFKPEQLAELKHERARLANRGRLVEAVRAALDVSV